ncbi:MAG: DUF5615 family PIN-like protein [Streptosporangiaceae bacterium]
MTSEPAARLALDEMYSPVIAQELRHLGFDVVAVAERADLRAMTDAEVFAWAAGQGRWLLTENVKDFRPLLLPARQADAPSIGILYTSSRSVARSRKKPGPLITAPRTWLAAESPEPRSPKTG